MNTVLWGTVALLALDASLIAAVLICRIVTRSPTLSLLEIGPLLVVAGVLTALIAFLFNLRRARSEDFLKAATELLEKAYETLAPKDGATEPTNRRLSWLTSARLVATSEMLGKRIAETSHLRVYGEKREYWRTRLYELIFPSPPSGLPSSFYAEAPEHMVAFSGATRDPLSEKSLAYLYRFIRWPESTTDPIGEAPLFTAEEIERMKVFGPRGLGELMAEVRSLQTAAGKQ